MYMYIYIYKHNSYYFYNTAVASYKYVYLMEVNSVNRDTFPIFMNQMNQAIIRRASKNSNVKISVTNAPFPMTKKIKGMSNTPSGFQVAFFYVVGLAFIPASIITFIVKEK